MVIHYSANMSPARWQFYFGLIFAVRESDNNIPSPYDIRQYSGKDRRHVVDA